MNHYFKYRQPPPHETTDDLTDYLNSGLDEMHEILKHGINSPRELDVHSPHNDLDLCRHFLPTKHKKSPPPCTIH
ncbi:hypothetical protein BURPS1710A_4198 [Burkholderia pseudomallei 1710a]|uniref:Uncharacterized protein n=1 Tax=Burkholderia pseudomallei 1710a TaxID=320371 RepID=A0A0E1W4T1_BURPE|nr:hypothetical protein BURPS1710A_4198 [Burkholderia pseudomallei 1710a]